MKRIILLCLVCLAIFADGPKPLITDAQRAKFWRARSEAAEALAQAERTKLALDAVVADLHKTCGDLQLNIGQDGEPTCLPKP